MKLLGRGGQTDGQTDQGGWKIIDRNALGVPDVVKAWRSLESKRGGSSHLRVLLGE